MSYLPSGKAIFLTTGVVLSIYLAVLREWNEYYKEEMEEININTIQFLCEGFIQIENPEVNLQTKRDTYFKYLLPRLVERWETVFPDFDLENPFTWPRPKNGRAYESTLIPTEDKSSQAYADHQNYVKQNQLFAGNYKIQAIIAYLFDKKLDLVTFRAKTHWKTILLYPAKKALISAFNKIIYSFTCCYDPFKLEVDYLSIFGDDYSWHVTNWPNPMHGKVGMPLDRNAHIDSGYHNIYSDGIPLSSHENVQIDQVWKQISFRKTSPLTIDDIKLMIMIFRMISVILSVDTPCEVVTIPNGTTGLYAQSHIPILLAIKQYMASNPNNPILKKIRSSSCCSQQLEEDEAEPEEEHYPLSFSLDASTVISFKEFNEIIKDYGTFLTNPNTNTNTNDENVPKHSNRLHQSCFKFNESVLMFGLCAHTTMWATEAITLIQQGAPTDTPNLNNNSQKRSINMMRKEVSVPRTIENCKIHIDGDQIYHLEKLILWIIERISFENSFLLQFLHDPVHFLNIHREKILFASNNCQSTSKKQQQHNNPADPKDDGARMPLPSSYLIEESKRLLKEFNARK